MSTRHPLQGRTRLVPAMLCLPATCRALAWASSQPRHQRRWLAARRAAPGRERARRLAAHDGSARSDDDKELPLPPIPPNCTGLSSLEMCARMNRFAAELRAYNEAVQRKKARSEARRAAGVRLPSRAPEPPPLAFLAAAWPPAADSTLPAASAARTAAAEATAAAAVAFAGAAMGHEAAAEAAHAAAATQPASAQAAAGEEWLRAGAAWRKAFESLEAAQRAHPGGAGAVQGAAAEVEAAQRFKHKLRGLCSRAAEGLQ